MTTAPESKRELTLLQSIGYGLGDIYGGGAGTLISFYYLIFLTDVVRIRPALAGTVILISKVYDALTDPFEGVIADRTRTRLGRRRPYLLAGIPPEAARAWSSSHSSPSSTPSASPRRAPASPSSSSPISSTPPSSASSCSTTTRCSPS